MNTIHGIHPAGHAAHVQIESRSICWQKASVNVGGLIASGLDISPSDFMNGDYIFNEMLDSDGSIINSGLINTSLGGKGGLGRSTRRKSRHD